MIIGAIGIAGTAARARERGDTHTRDFCMHVPTTARILPHRYGCAGERARADGVISHPPFPFTCGSIMLASTQLIVRRRVNSNGVSDGRLMTL